MFSFLNGHLLIGANLPQRSYDHCTLHFFVSSSDTVFMCLVVPPRVCSCWKDFQPLTADGLLYAIAHGQIPADVAASPEFVEQTLGDESWVLVREFNGNGAHGGDVGKNDVSTSDSKTAAENVTAFSSPVDLCDFLGEEAAAKKKIEASASGGLQRGQKEKIKKRQSSLLMRVCP